MIRTIIFDIGRVLVDYDWKAYLKSYGFDPKEEETIARTVFGGPTWKELDRGVLSIPELEDAFVSLAPQYREDILTVFRHSSRCIWRLDYAIEWICALKKRGYRVYYLSNYSEWMIERTRDALDFLPFMDGGLFSCEVGCVKPEPEIYQALLDRYPSIRPEESVFLDDVAENTAAAETFGMHGIVFKSKGQAERELDELLKNLS